MYCKNAKGFYCSSIDLFGLNADVVHIRPG